jgi:excinuclease ABC subunit B
MQRCLDETSRRRAIQTQHNEEHGIVPTSVLKSVEEVRFITRVADARTERDEDHGKASKRVAEKLRSYSASDPTATIAALEEEMREAAKNLDFETAARLRDELFTLRAHAGSTSAASKSGSSAGSGSGAGAGAARRAAR